MQTFELVPHMSADYGRFGLPPSLFARNRIFFELDVERMASRRDCLPLKLHRHKWEVALEAWRGTFEEIAVLKHRNDKVNPR